MGPRSSISPNMNGAGPEDPVEAAVAAGLRYVNDGKPGITRLPWGRGFTYRDAKGETIPKGSKARARIEGLAIPPAWTDVWICPHPKGHIQATGRDDRGRKQYRYHPRWREVRNATKFYRMIEFGEALPGIRARVRRDLSRKGLSREKVRATVVRLLETTCVRVGNAEYSRANKSFGLTTLRDRHVESNGAGVVLRFRGKGGQKQEINVSDRRVARIIRECEEIPGYELFQYYDENGERASIDSADVNEYLAEVTGSGFTAKDFRTWIGSVHALTCLCKCGPAGSARESKKNRLAAIDHAAEQLSNTRATCRKFYVHPGILDSYEEGWLCEVLPPEDFPPPADDGLSGEESALLEVLRRVERRRS